MTVKKRMSIDEIESILEKEEECEICILPNGEVVSASDADGGVSKLKPITMRERLGGEYAA